MNRNLKVILLCSMAVTTALAQDTLFVYKQNAMVLKLAANEIDSVIINKTKLIQFVKSNSPKSSIPEKNELNRTPIQSNSTSKKLLP